MSKHDPQPGDALDLSQQQTLLEYQAILENASVGILFTRDRRILHCNPKLSEIFGWPHGELVGQPGSVFYLSPEDYAEIGRTATPILAGGGQLDLEASMRRKDGSTVYCHLLAKAINPANTAEGTIWIAEDIGERKRIEAAMHELLLRQQAILENAWIGIVFTRDGEIVHCNPRAEEIYGWPPGSLMGQKAAQLFQDEADYARFGAVAGPVLSAGKLLDVEWRNVRRDGSLFWCRNLAKALQTDDGSRSTIWISEDIGRRKESESRLTQLLHDQQLAQEALSGAHEELERRVQERTVALALANDRLTVEVSERKEMHVALEQRDTALRQSNQQLETIIRSSPLAIYTRDLDSVVTTWNPAAERMFGWRAEEIIGQPVLTIPQEQIDEAERLRLRVLGGETIVQTELVRQRRDGSAIPISLTASPLRDAAGQIYGYLTIAADVSQRKADERQIEFLAYHDPLTGLPNRLLLQDRFEQAMAYAERAGTGLALLYLDLDDFKNINDSLGHATGDALLKEIAVRLGQCVRDTDTISRQGGDEFLVVLPDLPDAEAALPVLVKIMEKLQLPFHADDNELSTSASIGVAIYPDDGDEFETLLKKADMAMYRAKEAGRNAYRFFDETMNDEVVEHLRIRNGLRRALERGEFVLHYQPQLELAGGTVIGAEALLRWNHPELGMIPPGRFIPIAEESGLIVPIGEWVINEACRQGMVWQRAGLPELCLAVNLSAVQFKRGDVEKTVIDALQASGFDPQLLELELTESILIQNVENVLATVKRLKLLGVKLSIDDFGTGYSSLSYLKRFDIDKLKIDQSFIRDLAKGEDDAAIVRAIIQMARSLNLKTIAEGVEDAGILQRLRLLRCDEAQGFHFARPLPAEDFAAYLAARQEKLR